MAAGKNIRYWRERRAYGQGEFADMVGLTQTGLWRIENEKHGIKGATLRKIAEALKVDVDQLTAPDASVAPTASGT